MQRYCFTLNVRPDRLEEYVQRHREVWPEMLQALAETGWHNYSLFIRPDGLLVGYVEAHDLEAAREAMNRTRVNTRWQAAMADYFTELSTGAPDTAADDLELIFHLEDQLASTQDNPS